MTATSKCSIIFLLRYNQDGGVKGKQDDARDNASSHVRNEVELVPLACEDGDNDGPYYIYLKPIWCLENYLLFLSTIHD